MLVARQHTLGYLCAYLHSVGKEHGFHSLVQMERKQCFGFEHFVLTRTPRAQWEMILGLIKSRFSEQEGGHFSEYQNVLIVYYYR